MGNNMKPRPPQVPCDAFTEGYNSQYCWTCGFSQWEHERARNNAAAKTSPSHYALADGSQVIDLIVNVLASSQILTPFEGYCLGNVLKYVCRFTKHDGVIDLKKARRYLDWLIEHREKEGKISHE